MSNKNVKEYIKTYNLKKLEVDRHYVAFVINDDLKYIIKDNEPVQGDFGDLYDYFFENGFRIKGIELKNKHIEESFDGMLKALGYDKGRIESSLMSKVSLARGNGWMSTDIVLDRRIKFPDQMFIINNKYDIAAIQKACCNAKCGWVIIKRLALEHIESGREILNILLPVSIGRGDIHRHELYTSYIEKTDGKIAAIDKFNRAQLSFLFDENCSNIYDYNCNKSITEQIIKTTSCEGQF